MLSHCRAVARFAAALLAAASLACAALAQDVEAGRTKAAACAACHGQDGNSKDPLSPTLAGQTARYIYLQLRDIKEGRRSVPAMKPSVENLSSTDMLNLAAFFAAQRLAYPDYKTDSAKVARGRAKADETLCTMCHLGGFKGQNAVPRVAGQHHDYIVKQLNDFKQGHRTNDSGTMSSVAKTLSEQDMDDLANYLTGLN